LLAAARIEIGWQAEGNRVCDSMSNLGLERILAAKDRTRPGGGGTVCAGGNAAEQQCVGGEQSACDFLDDSPAGDGLLTA